MNPKFKWLLLEAGALVLLLLVMLVVFASCRAASDADRRAEALAEQLKQAQNATPVPTATVMPSATALPTPEQGAIEPQLPDVQTVTPTPEAVEPVELNRWCLRCGPRLRRSLPRRSVQRRSLRLLLRQWLRGNLPFRCLRRRTEGLHSDFRPSRTRTLPCRSACRESTRAQPGRCTGTASRYPPTRRTAGRCTQTAGISRSVKAGCIRWRV